MIQPPDANAVFHVEASIMDIVEVAACAHLVQIDGEGADICSIVTGPWLLVRQEK